MALVDHVGRFILRTDECDSEKAIAILRFFTIHESERVHFPDGIEYVASCPLFRKRNIGERIPYYIIHYRNGQVTAEEITHEL